MSVFHTESSLGVNNVVTITKYFWTHFNTSPNGHFIVFFSRFHSAAIPYPSSLWTLNEGSEHHQMVMLMLNAHAKLCTMLYCEIF